MEKQLEINELAKENTTTLLERIIYIFTDPKRSFESLKENPKVLGVYLISLIISSLTLIWGYLDGSSEKVFIDQLAQTGQPITEQVVVMGKLLTLFGGAFIFAIVPFISAFFYHIIVMINSETGYKKTLAITRHASLIASLNTIISLFVLKLAGITLQFSPAMFLDANEMSSVLYALISFIDLFVFWRVVVLFIGFRTTHNLSKKGALITAIIPDLVLYAIALITISITM
ncbi:MAG: YIP1 family protein [Clostridiales bacterium]|nr:YIP1 family protein [Clostridiales bacterium]